MKKRKRRSSKSVLGIPNNRLDRYLGPKQLDELYDSYGADRVHKAIHIRRRQRGMDGG